MLDRVDSSLRDKTIAEVKDLRVEFQTKDGPVVGVSDVSFNIKSGETVCLVGESGSGKSVSSLSLMRLVEFGGGEITGGRLLFNRKDSDEIDLAKTDPNLMRSIRGNEIGMIFQEPMTALNPVFTVERQLTEGLRLHASLSRSAASARALELMREVRIPEPERRLKQYPHELSGGMRQRVVIAMALACKPRLLIADEPTTALDVTIQAEILALIDRLKRETGTAVMFITHDMAVVAQMADRVVVMFRGKKVEEGTVEEIFENPQHLYTKALLAAVPKLGEMSGKKYPEPMVLMSRQQSAAVPIKGTNELLLEVESLTTRFAVKGGMLRRKVANVHAVEDVSFTINKGQTLGLVGESGCGKSTLAKALIYLDPPSQGSVSYNGKPIVQTTTSLRKLRKEIQFIFQDPYAALHPLKTIGSAIEEVLYVHGIAVSSKAQKERSHQLLYQVNLAPSFYNRYPHELSGGQRQRAVIARALATEPKLLICDESVAALDISVQAQVLNLLNDLKKELGLSYLFISHDLAVVKYMSDRVMVMENGYLLEIQEADALYATPKHPYTQKLIDAIP